MSLNQISIVTPSSRLDYQGKEVRIPGELGKTLVCFFAKDRTPCCGRERRALCDKLALLKKANINIVAVSRDHTKNHKAFEELCSDAYVLVPDHDFVIANQFGVSKKETYKDREYKTVKESAFLLDATGVVLSVFKNFDLEHQVLDVLKVI